MRLSYPNEKEAKLGVELVLVSEDDTRSLYRYATNNKSEVYNPENKQWKDTDIDVRKNLKYFL